VTRSVPLPTPVSVTESGLPEAPENVIETEPLRVPAPPGVKFTWKPQAPPFGGRTEALVQPLNGKVKSAAFVPPIVTVPIVTGTVSPFAVGDRVFHIKFGNGDVIAVDGNKLTIAFDKAGEKRVVDSFVERV